MAGNFASNIQQIHRGLDSAEQIIFSAEHQNRFLFKFRFNVLEHGGRKQEKFSYLVSAKNRKKFHVSFYSAS